MERCPWAKNDLSKAYHDTEWGIPVRDDRVLFEFLILEGAQAGLSWDTILAKRARYREVYRDFDVEKVARFGPRDVERLLSDPGIVRNRLKVHASIANARATLQIVREHGSLAAFLWKLVDPDMTTLASARPVVNRWERMAQVPARTDVSDRMSKALKKAGMAFVGTTICYAFMQATGMVNDHLITCPRHAEILRQHPARR